MRIRNLQNKKFNYQIILSDAADSHLKINTFAQEAAQATLENAGKHDKSGNKVCTVYE